MNGARSKTFLGALTLLIAMSLICFSFNDAQAGRRDRKPRPPVEEPAPVPTPVPTEETVGTIEEVIQDDDRTLVRINNGAKSTWVATPSMNVSVGETISLKPGMKLNGHHMKRLNRTFDSVVFSDGRQ